MMKSEFEALIGKEIPIDEYKVIDKVYTFHPAISETSGKKEIAELYMKFGLSVIQGMLPAAKAFELLEDQEALISNKIEVLEVKLAEIRETKKALKSGDFNPLTVVQNVIALIAEGSVDYEEERE